MHKNSRPTVVLGFDALSFRYLDAFDLPNFDALRDEGVAAPLRSTHPPWTASAWPSMYTGVDPSHHGVYDFFAHQEGYPDEGRVVTRDDVRAPALWNYLSVLGVPSVVLNMPVTYPAEPIEGTLIPGYLAPEDAEGAPEGAREELSTATGEYRIYSRAELSDDKGEKLDGYVELIDLRRRAAEHLLASVDWQLAIIQVQKTDAVFHNFHSREAFQRIYEAADALLGGVRSAVDGETNFVVCSDHGIGPVTGYKIYLNEILRQHGFVETTTNGERTMLGEKKTRLVQGGGMYENSTDSAECNSSTPTDQSNTANLSGSAGPSLPAQALSAAETVLRRIGVTPADVYAAATRLGIDEAVLRLLPAEAETSVGEYVDWRASQAYCRSSSEYGIRLNVAGRELDGVVSPDEYEDVRNALINLLSGLETPAGEPAFEFVAPREEVYTGPHADRACDVLFRPAGMNHIIARSLLGKPFVPVEAYEHKRDGVFVGTGPSFESTADAPDGLSLIDIAPIVMTSLGRDVPERMTGVVPENLLSVPTTHQEYGDIAFAAGTGRTERDDHVEERLSDLGYL